MVMEQESYLESMEEYMEESYRNIEVHGNVMRKETKGEADRIVNEINACIPDIVFVCIPAVYGEACRYDEYTSLYSD